MWLIRTQISKLCSKLSVVSSAQKKQPNTVFHAKFLKSAWSNTKYMNKVVERNLFYKIDLLQFFYTEFSMILSIFFANVHFF